MSPSMPFNELLRRAGLSCSEGCDAPVTGLSYDSRVTRSGDLFFAWKGRFADGHNYLGEVEQKGAVAAVVEKRRPLNLPQIETRDMAGTMARISDQFFSHPSSRIPVIGITGTNGKTTTTFLMEDLLTRTGERCGVMGTVNYRLGHLARPAPNTTPLSIDVQSFIHEASEQSASCVVMEVSSHALALRRVDYVDFKVAVFTNLTQDHLDFHNDMESYFQAKAKLFMNPKTRCVVNVDDPYGERLFASRPDALTFGFSAKAQLRASAASLSLSGIQFSLTFPSGSTHHISTNLMGEHNISNCLAAASGMLAFGMPEEKIVGGLNSPHNVPGRLERVEAGQDFVVVVDYAHTHDALEKVLRALRQTKPKRVLTLFGAGGDRDRTKRPKMGRVATDLSDFVIITSDNPRSEDPLRIIEDIKAGIRRDNYVAIPERESAIKEMLNHAQQGDILLLAGKGHEEYQIIGNVKMPFSDTAVVKKVLLR